MHIPPPISETLPRSEEIFGFRKTISNAHANHLLSPPPRQGPWHVKDNGARGRVVRSPSLWMPIPPTDPRGARCLFVRSRLFEKAGGKGAIISNTPSSFFCAAGARRSDRPRGRRIFSRRRPVRSVSLGGASSVDARLRHVALGRRHGKRALLQ